MFNVLSEAFHSFLTCHVDQHIIPYRALSTVIQPVHIIYNYYYLYIKS